MTALRSISHSFLKVLTRLPLRDIIPDLWRALRGIARALWYRTTNPAARDLGLLRELHCRQCPMYSEQWQTCGEPGEIDEDTGTKIGCWCFTPLANADPKKDCWARANGLEHVGWPDALRSVDAVKASQVNALGGKTP